MRLRGRQEGQFKASAALRKIEIGVRPEQRSTGRGRCPHLKKYMGAEANFLLHAGSRWVTLPAFWGEQQPFTVTRLWGAALFLGRILGGVQDAVTRCTRKRSEAGCRVMRRRSIAPARGWVTAQRARRLIQSRLR